MPPEESTYPADWRRIAEKDFARVERALRDHDPEAAGFFLQQAVEKFLKAFLLSKGWKLRRIHDLEALLDDALAFDPTLEGFRTPCQSVTAFYLVQRYPLTTSPPSQEDVRRALADLLPLVQQLRSKTESATGGWS